MPTRKHIHQIDLEHTPERVFALLVTPSAIRGWWGAARAIVVPQVGGLWATTWGENEDDPDYIVAHTIMVYEPPRRLGQAPPTYNAKTRPLPSDAPVTTQFAGEPRAGRGTPA